MRTTFLLTLTVASTLVLSLPAQARTVFPAHPTFEHILPDGYALTDAPAVDPATLRAAKVAVIPTENMNLYAQGWLDYYENGGAEHYWAVQLLGLSRDDLASARRASDPRNITDAMVDLIRPYFGEVIVAQDLASAHDQGAEYFVILDCRMSAPAWGSHFRYDGGVYLLDASLHRVFEATGFGEVSRGGLLSNPLTQDPIAMDQSITAMIAKVSDAVHTRLGQPPAPTSPASTEQTQR